MRGDNRDQVSETKYNEDWVGDRSRDEVKRLEEVMGREGRKGDDKKRIGRDRERDDKDTRRGGE